MNVALWLDRTARADPGRPALGHGLRTIASYGALATRAAHLAGALRDGLKLRPGERVAVVARNCPEYVEILAGIWTAGLAAVPVNARLHGAEIGYILAHSGARACLLSAELDATVGAHAPPSLQHVVRIGTAGYARLLAAEPICVAERAPGDLAWLFYTSGTTGRPKGAMITHGVLAAASFAYALEVDPIAPGDSLVHAAPLSHGSGLYLMAHVLRGGINVIPESGGFEPEEISRAFAHWRRMSMFAAPTMVNRLAASRADWDPSAARTVVYGGAPMYVADSRAALDRLGPCLAQIYGLGESPMTITTLPKAEIADRAHPRWLDRLASAGRAYGCVEVAVLDEGGWPLAPGEAGEIACRGSPVMPGYWNDPEATARALRDGWLHTGDIGALDAEGYLTLKDRSKDLIISGGSNIYPREVEEVLLAHPGIREVSVIGRPDSDWGEVAVAYVVGDGTVPELDALCLSRIARFKRPKHYVFVESLPKNNYGKVLKTELRAMDERSVGGDR